jgi:hypothetical protein
LACGFKAAPAGAVAFAGRAGFFGLLGLACDLVFFGAEARATAGLRLAGVFRLDFEARGFRGAMGRSALGNASEANERTRALQRPARFFDLRSGIV